MKTRKVIKNIIMLTGNAAIFLAVLILITAFLFRFAVVNGDSMDDNLQNGDILFAIRTGAIFGSPDRFDVVVFSPEGDINPISSIPFMNRRQPFYIKRVIGLPGETVRIEKGNIYINGEVLYDKYGNENILDPGIAAEDVVLGEDEYFCIGDNRNNSRDCRIIGPIRKTQIYGVATFRIFPFSKIENI